MQIIPNLENSSTRSATGVTGAAGAAGAAGVAAEQVEKDGDLLDETGFWEKMDDIDNVEMIGEPEPVPDVKQKWVPVAAVQVPRWSAPHLLLNIGPGDKWSDTPPPRSRRSPIPLPPRPLHTSQGSGPISHNVGPVSDLPPRRARRARRAPGMGQTLNHTAPLLEFTHARQAQPVPEPVQPQSDGPRYSAPREPTWRHLPKCMGGKCGLPWLGAYGGGKRTRKKRTHKKRSRKKRSRKKRTLKKRTRKKITRKKRTT